MSDLFDFDSQTFDNLELESTAETDEIETRFSVSYLDQGNAVYEDTPSHISVTETSVPELSGLFSGNNEPSFYNAAYISDTDTINYSNNLFQIPENIQSVESGSSVGVMVGSPEKDLEYWHQQHLPDSYGIVSQEYILESFFGTDFSELDLVQYANEQNYYVNGAGTFPIHIGSLLEDCGIEVTRTIDNSFFDLLSHLEKGHKIIVSVDSNEIWSNSNAEQLIDLISLPRANHAVEVIGYDSEKEIVILNDPGHPNGAGMMVPLQTFVQAWQDGNNFIMATIQSPEEFVSS